jgi:phage recombination protein Bet
MTKQIVTQEQNALIEFDDEQVGLIKRTIAKGATDDELSLFLHQAKRTGLDPLAKQIYFQKYNTKSGPQIAIITGIDGYRLIADRTGVYAGNDEPVFDGRKKYNGVDVPVKATTTVWKFVGGQRVPFSASVYWDEYCPDPPRDYQWKKMPHVMLAKCSEAAALRKAFPADLGNMYTAEEMEQANLPQVTVIQADAKPAQISRKPAPAPDVQDGDFEPIQDDREPRTAEEVHMTMIAAIDPDDQRPATEGQLKFARSALSKLVASDTNKAKAILAYLFDIGSSKDLTMSMASQIIDWSGSTKENEYTVSPVAAQEAERIYTAWLRDQGQQDLFPE